MTVCFVIDISSCISAAKGSTCTGFSPVLKCDTSDRYVALSALHFPSISSARAGNAPSFVLFNVSVLSPGYVCRDDEFCSVRLVERRC